MRKAHERSGSLWTPTRRELLGSIGVLGAGLLLPKPAKAVDGFQFLRMASTYDGTVTIDATGADLLVGFATARGGSNWRQYGPDSTGNTWTKLTQWYGGYGGQAQLFYCANPVISTSLRVPFTSGSFGAATSYIAAFSGSQLVLPFDVEAGANSSGGGYSYPGTITPSTGNQLIVSGIATDNSGDTPNASGMTLIKSNPQMYSTYCGGGMAFTIQSAASAYTAEWSGNGSSVVASFKSSFVGGAAAKVVHRVVSGG